MTQKIIALVDGSPYSTSVCDHTAWIAQRTAASVTLLHVLGRREAVASQDLSGAIALGARSTLMQDLAELDAQRAKLVATRGRAILDDAQAIVAGAGVADVTTRLRHGDIVETVAELDAEASLLVIGKRGEAADFAKGHLGSNLERIVRASQTPVFVASRAYRPVTRVLVAFDGGASAVKAVDHIAQSPLFAGLDISLVMVGTPAPDAHGAIMAAKARLMAAGLTVQARQVDGAPDTALAALVAAEDIGLLVMGAYGHSRIRSLVIGSTTTQMLRACPVPVLLVR